LQIQTLLSFYFFLASNIVELLQNYYCNEGPAHVINVAILPCKMKCSLYRIVRPTSQHQNGQSSRKNI